MQQNSRISLSCCNFTGLNIIYEDAEVADVFYEDESWISELVNWPTYNNNMDKSFEKNSPVFVTFF